MTIKFTGPTKHQGYEFLPATALDFEDDRVEEYFIAAGWAEVTTDPPVKTYYAGTVTVDPNTVDNLTGARVLTVTPLSPEDAAGKAAGRRAIHEALMAETPPDELSVQANEEVAQGKDRKVLPKKVVKAPPTEPDAA
jgi:hypothetical protein